MNSKVLSERRKLSAGDYELCWNPHINGLDLTFYYWYPRFIRIWLPKWKLPCFRLSREINISLEAKDFKR